MKKNILLAAGLVLLLALMNAPTMAQIGSTCANPYIVTSVPFSQTSMTTAGSGNAYDNTMACASNYMNGEDFVFSYAPLTDQYVTIALSNTGNAVGLFVLDSCPDMPGANCVASTEAMLGNPSLANVHLIGGITYYIIVSTLDPIIILPNPSTDFDIAIDTINPNDAVAIGIAGPLSSCSLNNEHVSMILTNNGIAPIDSLDLGYMINGGLVVTETYFPTLNPGDTVAYTFTSTVDMSALNGVFDIAAFTMLAGDKDNANDTAYGMVAHLNTVSAFPYYEDFESGIGSWIGSAGSSWQWGEPAKPIINHAASTSHCWTTNLTGNTLAGENSFLSGPCFDFSSLTNPFIRFNLWYETTMLSSSAILEASADQGATWTKIGNSTDSSGHWYNSFNSLFEPAWTGSSSGWVLMQHALDGFAGEPDVSIRVVYSGGFSIIPPTEGLAVDDMEIFECIVANADFTFTVNGNLVSFNNASTNSTHYEWDFGDGSGASTTNTSHTYSTPGSYTATLYAFNDCSVDTLTQVFNFTGIGENDETPVFSCHPNPGNGKFIVSGSTSAQSEIKMTVSNALGENVFSEVIPGTNGILNTEVDLTFLSKGIYFLNVATQQHSSVIKLVIE